MSGTRKRKKSLRPELKLAIQYGVQSSQVPSRAQFRKWAHAALRRTAMVTLRVVGTREARALNRRYCGRDYATNVLSFAYRKRGPLEGDIAICAPVAIREARAQGIRREAHYAHLFVHGILHLQGHDHQRAADAKRMERLECGILQLLGYANPYALSDEAQPQLTSATPR